MPSATKGEGGVISISRETTKKTGNKARETQAGTERNEGSGKKIPRTLHEEMAHTKHPTPSRS